MFTIVVSSGLEGNLSLISGYRPVNIFLYHVSTCSSVTSGSSRLGSSMAPSSLITRYVGIRGSVDGERKSIDVTRGLLTAPGNRLTYP